MGTAEIDVGVIMPFIDIAGRMIDAGVDPEKLARVENIVGLFMFLALCAFLFWDCCRAKPTDTADLAGH